MSKSDMPPEVSAFPDRPALHRAARWLVIIMSVLLALAFVAVVWGFIRQGRILMESRAARQAATAATVPARMGAGPLVTLTLQPGVRIVSAQAEAGKLVLHVSGPHGAEVQVMDLATGALTADIRTSP